MADSKPTRMNDSAADVLEERPSKVEEGVIGKHGSTSPLIELVHNGEAAGPCRVTMPTFPVTF